MVFGDGADGGREAVYDGTLDYPSREDGWSGYIVMQAKFLQVSKSPAEDANWLASQLEAELQKFTKSGSRLRKPRYYILVSNARLSPKPSSSRGRGGLAKIDAVFAKHRRKLGLVGYSVWHLDQLATFLTGADSLRRSYAAWLSSSDVIADLLADLGARKRATSNAMLRYLSRELRTHQPIRLQQAGHSGDVATMIEDVFTDLPYRRLADAGNAPDSLLLADLLERSRDRLDQASVKAQPSGNAGRPERILLLGGPGQGKSTISQFIAQIFRANILRTDRADLLPAEIDRIVESTLAKSATIMGTAPPPRRFPFRVDLPSFADKLSRETGDAPMTLLRYLCSEITRIADAEVGVEELRLWLAGYPSLMILDGLDEVPPSSNRAAVIRAINEFWDEIVDGDLLMIVTTRPQGYNDDLDPGLYGKLEMSPLSPEQAVGYATKLAENRLSDLNQRERVIDRMKEAARSPTTSRLMVSPLQVAILLALIDQRGDAPSDRWSLFEKYFMVVLEREQGKSGAVGETMRHWSRQIIALHHKAGFLLHVEAETRGNSEAYLTQAELRDLIRGQLADEEFEGDELDGIAAELLAASTERLVLLVQREEGSFSFEVRSLQEFMAAAHLMTGREAVVQQRLETIANRNHWLHVFQIASSKCFAVADSQHLRDTVVTICRSLNEAGDEIDRYLRTGSRLALALLDDGLAYDQPKYRRLLLALAFDMLLTGPDRLPPSLTLHCAKEPQRTIEHLRQHAASTLDEPREASWLLLLRLALEGQAWARELLKEIIPTDAVSSAKIIAMAKGIGANDLLDAVLRAALERTSLDEISRQLARHDVDRFERRDWIAQLFPCLGLLIERGSEVAYAVVGGDQTPLSLQIALLAVSERREEIYNDVPLTATWEPVRALIAFHRDPHAAALALLLRNAAANEWLETYVSILQGLPWPLATVVWLASRGARLDHIAEQVSAGDFGDKADWIAAEERWLKQGIQQSDLELWQNGWFFNARVGVVGAPWSPLSLEHRNRRGKWVDWLFGLALQARDAPRLHLRQLVLFVTRLYPTERPINVKQARFFVEHGVGRLGSERLEAAVLENVPVALLDQPDLLADLDRWGREGHVYLGGGREPWKPELPERLISHLEQYPGLIAFLGSILSAGTSPLSLFAIPDATLSELQRSAVPTIAGYARVFAMLQNVVGHDDVAAIFASGGAEGFPVALLRLVLEGNRLDVERRLAIGELVAAQLNTCGGCESREFVMALNAIADQRLAPLRDAESWTTLELGGMLFEQIGKRGQRV